MGVMKILKAVYIIKPEAMIYRNKIRKQLKIVGLRVISYKVIVMDEELLLQIYSDCNMDIQNAATKYMMCGESEIGIVEGTNTIEKLLDVSGRSANPSNCKKGTIRNQYGIRKGIKVGRSIYYKNAFHRSKNGGWLITPLSRRRGQGSRVLYLSFVERQSRSVGFRI